jgi:hypothetical protein
MKRIFTPEQKGRIALEAIRGEQTISQLASKHEIFISYCNYANVCLNHTDLKIPVNDAREPLDSVRYISIIKLLTLVKARSITLKGLVRD